MGILNKTTNALAALVLTPHIREHLRQHDPKALEQAITALRDTLSETELGYFEENLARVSSEASKTKLWAAHITVYLPKPHWTFTTRDNQTMGEVVLDGPPIPYLSRG